MGTMTRFKWLKKHLPDSMEGALSICHELMIKNTVPDGS